MIIMACNFQSKTGKGDATKLLVAFAGIISDWKIS
jgi:hypothetical protein